MLQGVVYQDVEGKITSMNSAAERILGKTPAEFMGSSSVSEEHDTIREDGSPFPGMEHPAMVSLQTGQKIKDVVMGVYNPREKRYRWISVDAVPIIRPGEDQPFQVYTLFSDITERKRAEEELRESEERYRTFFENSIDAVLLTSSDGTIYAANPEAFYIFGMTEEEIIRAGENGVVSDPRFPRALEERARTGKFKGELNYRRKNGTIFPGEVSTSLFTDKNGFVKTVTIIRDVTKRKQAELELQESEKRYRTLFDKSMDGIILTDPRGVGIILSANPAACRMLGWTEEELLLKGLDVIFDVKNPALSTLLDENIPSGSTKSITYARMELH
jgi:PAS domain S-box-containing protein